MTPKNVLVIKQKDIYKRLITVAELLNKSPVLRQSKHQKEQGLSEKTQNQQAVVS